MIEQLNDKMSPGQFIARLGDVSSNSMIAGSSQEEMKNAKWTILLFKGGSLFF